MIFGETICYVMLFLMASLFMMANGNGNGKKGSRRESPSESVADFGLDAIEVGDDVFAGIKLSIGERNMVNLQNLLAIGIGRSKTFGSKGVVSNFTAEDIVTVFDAAFVRMNKWVEGTEPLPAIFTDSGINVLAVADFARERLQTRLALQREGSPLPSGEVVKVHLLTFFNAIRDQVLAKTSSYEVQNMIRYRWDDAATMVKGIAVKTWRQFSVQVEEVFAGTCRALINRIAATIPSKIAGDGIRTKLNSLYFSKLLGAMKEHLMPLAEEMWKEQTGVDE